MANTSDHTNVLAPFGEEDQKFLLFLDETCRQMSNESKSFLQQMQNEQGEDFHIPPDVAIIMNLIRGFGILFNRAVDAGWIDSIHLEKDGGPKIIT